MNRPKDEQYDDYLIEAFTTEAKRESDKLTVAALVAGGLAWTFTGNAIAGLALGCCIMLYSDRSVRQSNRALEAIQQTRLAAPFLTGDAFQKFRRRYGDDLVLAQLREAREYKLPFQNDPEDFLYEKHPELEKPEPTKRAEPETAAEPKPTPKPEDSLALLKSLTASPLQPTIVAGLPGSGKGVMTAMALSLAHQSGLRFWVFTPKTAIREAGYWVRAERLYLSDRLNPAIDLFSHVIQVLDEFAAVAQQRNEQAGDHPPFILLLEEITAIVGGFTPKQKQLYKQRVVALASLVRACNMALWVSGQSPTLEDLGLTGEANRSMFHAVVATGDKRDGLPKICSLLEIPAPGELPAGRWWITTTGNYPAIACPKVPTFPDWQSVTNLRDLRPKSTESVAIDDPDQETEQQHELPQMGETLDDVEAYIKERGEVPISAIKNWGKTRRKGSLTASEIEELLIELVNFGRIEKFTPTDSKSESAKWIGGR